LSLLSIDKSSPGLPSFIVAMLLWRIPGGDTGISKS